MIFIVAEPTIGYLGNQAPDFFSWRSGVFDLRGETVIPAVGRKWEEFVPYSQTREETSRRILLLQEMAKKENIKRKLNHTLVASLYHSLGSSYFRLDELVSALAAWQEALKLYRKTNSLQGEANTLEALGDLKVRTDDLKGAREDYERALPIYRQIEDRLGEANTLKALGDLKVRTSDLKGAREDYERALPIYRQIEARLGEANTLQRMGNLLNLQGDFNAGNQMLLAALNIHLRIEDYLGVGGDLVYLSRGSIRAGKLGQAILFSDLPIPFYHRLGDRFSLALVFDDQAVAFREEENQAWRAAGWLAWKLFEEIGDSSAKRWEEQFMNLRASIGEGKYYELIADLEQNAESYRRAAVEEIKKTHGDDPLYLEVVALIRKHAPEFLGEVQNAE